MLININFSSLNLQDHCASIVGHTSTTGRHVSLSFDFFYCHCCTSFGLWILYSFRFTTAGLHYIPTLIMSFLNKCYCWESVVHAVHRWYIPLKFIVPYTVCLAISIFGHSRHLTHSPGVWSLCSISYGSAFVNRKELASCDESAALITVELIFWQLFYMMRKIWAEYLNVQDVACGTNILTGLVQLVRYLQVGGGGGGVFWLTAPILSWSTLKENSEQNSKILSENICYSSIVYFLLGISLASNCSWPTFRNPVSVPSSKAGCAVYSVHPAFEDGTDTGFRNVG